MDNFEKILPAVNNPNINKNPSNIDSSKTAPLNVEKFDKTEVSRLIDDLVSLSEDREAYKIRKELIRILNLGRPTEPLLAPVDTIAGDPYEDYLKDIGRYDLLSNRTEDTPVSGNFGNIDDYIWDALGNEYYDRLEGGPTYDAPSLNKFLNSIRENFLKDYPDSETILNNLFNLQNYLYRVEGDYEEKYCREALDTLIEFFRLEENTSKENYAKHKEKMYQIFIQLQEILRKNFAI